MATQLIGYLAEKGIVTDWYGEPIGTYKITSTWKTPRSYISSEMWQVEAILDRVKYTGRSAGIGMALAGKPKAKQ